MKKKTLSLMLMLALMLGLVIPANRARAAEMPVTSVQLCVGAVYTLRPTGLVGTIKWTTSDNEVASVDATGMVVARSKGTAVIRAAVGSVSVSCTVNVKKKSKKLGSKYNPKIRPGSTKWFKFTYFMEGKEIGEFRIQIQKFVYGREAAAMAAAAGKNVNPVPTSTQQYLYFRIRMQYLSGTGTQTVKMSDVFDYNHNVFGSYGAVQLSPISWGYGFEAYQDMMSVNISPGNDITAGKAILVPNGFKPVTIRFQTGKNSYTWIKM